MPPAKLLQPLLERLAIVENNLARHEADDKLIHSSVLKAMDAVGTKVDDIKERLDKQNGAIPHIQESIANIEKHLTEQDRTVLKTSSILAKVKLKSNIIWAIMATIGVAVAEYLVHVVFKL